MGEHRLPPALSFEGRLKYYRLMRAFTFEINAILWGATAALLFLQQHSAIILATASMAVLATTYAVLYELRRRRRRLRMGTVSSVREIRREHGLYVPFVPFMALTFRQFEVEVTCDKDFVVRYVDCEPRRVGDRVLLLLDHVGNVLAVNPLNRLISLDMLKKL